MKKPLTKKRKNSHSGGWSVETNKLKDLFQRYMKLHLIGNQHLIDALFFSFCGMVFQIRCVYSGIYIRPRVCTFTIQDSGTGKGQAMNALYWLLIELFPRSVIAKRTTVTDAALIGSPEEDIEKERKQSRLLFKKEGILWSEGGVLLKAGPYSENQQDIIQMATEEPGWVAKSLKDGEIEGPTHTTIIAGSYFDDKTVKVQILKRGFFPRLFVTFKKFTKKEKLNIQKELYKLERTVTYWDRRKLIGDIRGELIGKYNFSFPRRFEEFKNIELSEEISKRSSEKMLSYYEHKILEQYSDERQDALESVWNRVRLMVFKISIQNAYLNGRSEVTDEDMDFAFSTVEKYHIQGIKNLLDFITDEKHTLEKVDRNKQKNTLLIRIRELKKRFGESVPRPKFIEYLKAKNKKVEKSCQVPYSRALELLKELEIKDKLIKVNRNTFPHTIAIRRIKNTVSEHED